MTFRDHGYYGYAYFGARLAQGITLVPIIGLVGNLLSLIARSKHSPPSELVATIIFTALSTLWVVISLTAYDDTHIPYIATLAVDLLFLIPFMVFATVLGQPLSVTTCSELSKESSNVALPVSSLAGQPVSYVIFTGSGRTVCYELMAAWGLIIALCVLFAISSIAAGFLFVGKRSANIEINAMHSGSGFPGGGAYPNESQIEMAKGSAFSSRAPSFRQNISSPGTPIPSTTTGPSGIFPEQVPRAPSPSYNSEHSNPLSPPPRR